MGEEKTTIKRKPKSQGILKGSSKKSDISKRYKICRKLVSPKSEPIKTQNDFLEKYRNALKANGVDPIPSEQTLKKDMAKCHIKFKYGIAQISEDESIFASLGIHINYYLRQIRLVYGSNDIILLNTYTNPMLYPKTLNDFLSPIAELVCDSPDEKNVCSPNTDSVVLADKPKKIAKSHIMYLHFILDKKGLEFLIEDAFCKDCDTPPYFLYIETHSYCTTIVLEYRHLKTILRKAYEIIEESPFQ